MKIYNMTYLLKTKWRTKTKMILVMSLLMPPSDAFYFKDNNSKEGHPGEAWQIENLSVKMELITTPRLKNRFFRTSPDKESQRYMCSGWLLLVSRPQDNGLLQFWVLGDEGISHPVGNSGHIFIKHTMSVSLTL